MNDVATLLSAIAQLTWPILLGGLLLYFGSVIRQVISSLGSRNFKINVAGMELTAEESAEQQRRLIADLQEKVVQLSVGVTSQLAASPTPSTETHTKRELSQRILWVDDYPSNNAQLVANLREKDVEVDLALNTADALRLFGTKSYRAIISDMGRHEDGRNVPDAGVRFVRSIRELDAQIPVIIFCSSRGVSVHGEEAMKAGASAVTSSSLELLTHVARKPT